MYEAEGTVASFKKLVCWHIDISLLALTEWWPNTLSKKKYLLFSHQCNVIISLKSANVCHWVIRALIVQSSPVIIRLNLNNRLMY